MRYFCEIKEDEEVTLEKTAIERKESLQGEATVPGDKSISHRAIIIGSLAKGKTSIKGISKGDDNLRTMKAFQMMGVDMEESEGESLIIHGKGLYGLAEPKNIIDAGNSGTTMRLLTGLLSGQKFFSVITGDSSLRKRPMKRVVEPLRSMGAKIWGRHEGEFAPLAINGTDLCPIDFLSPITSAQMKSAILLGGLYADGITKVSEPRISRDHTERMLTFFGADLKRENNAVSLTGRANLEARDIEIPGDISSAAFLMVAALITPNSEVLLKGVGINQTRTGVLDILKRMGADIHVNNVYERWDEPAADISVRTSRLRGITIDGEMVPRAIDEFPILSVAASVAEGKTIIKDAQELRVKETDRIKAMADELRKFGVDVVEFDDGMAIIGRDDLKGCECYSHGDHRVAMSLLVAGLRASGKTIVQDTSCIRTSFPDFQDTLFSLIDS
ncbi:MAG: 3-phosphoshikimate 1-carboxyvinyltransferase [Thermodesulfobacteriota bacterium]|nr:3-phosphoshikimate 1-carboxyvinyltransferase [Thermodesulfobacteriota bacterium]